MTAPRPHDTSPFHPPSSVYDFTNVSISVYIQKFSSYFFHVVFKLSFGTVYISHFRMRSCRNTLEVILALTWYVLVCAIYPRSSVCISILVSILPQVCCLRFTTTGALTSFFCSSRRISSPMERLRDKGHGSHFHALRSSQALPSQ